MENVTKRKERQTNLRVIENPKDRRRREAAKQYRKKQRQFAQFLMVAMAVAITLTGVALVSALILLLM